MPFSNKYLNVLGNIQAASNIFTKVRLLNIKWNSPNKKAYRLQTTEYIRLTQYDPMYIPPFLLFSCLKGLLFHQLILLDVISTPKREVIGRGD